MNFNWRAWVPRLTGVVAGVVASKLTEASGIVVDPASLTGVALGIYALSHRVVSAKVNPGDAASKPVIKEDQAIKDAAPKE